MNHSHLEGHSERLDQVLFSILNIHTSLKYFMPWFLLILCVVLILCLLYLAYTLQKAKKKLAIFTSRYKKARRTERDFDPLTQLPTRQQLEKKINQTQSADQSQCSYALMLISIDNLGSINDVHSYAIGDVLFKHIALRLNHLLEHSDFLAHLNSNKFALLTKVNSRDTGDTHAYLTQLAKDLQKSIEVPYFIDDLALRAATSIGIALICNTNKSPKKIIHQAHMALVQAKTYRSQSIQFFNNKLSALIKRTELLTKELPFAIGRNQLAVYVHPQHSMQGQLAGVELLLRWHHPSLGKIPPEHFIALAEKDNMINCLSLWMLDEAVKFVQEYPLPELSVSINVSPLQFHSAHFEQFINYLHTHADILADRLVIEITENALMENLKEAKRIMHALTRLGYRLSLDDFGTGFSNLAAISSFPLYEIKLDRSLIHNLSHEKQLRIIAEMTVKLAKTLQLNTVAEGVENQEDLNLLTELGFDYVQGYYYSRPMPLAKWPSYLAQCTPSIAAALPH